MSESAQRERKMWFKKVFLLTFFLSQRRGKLDRSQSLLPQEICAILFSLFIELT